ncbi:MAG: hypothetical protein KDD51_11785 [Bdellovibrionales bacterium]|nr:hypothetical protein [Bdellovibrionales bacterium]
MSFRRKHIVYAVLALLLALPLQGVAGDDDPKVMDRAQCLAYYEAMVGTRRNLQIAASDPKTQQAFRQLDPTNGVGFLTFDVSGALPVFLQKDNYKQIDWPAKGTFVFAGDRTVPHYVDIDTAQKQLSDVVGKEKLAQLQGFGDSMLRFVYDQLPEEEKSRMAKNQVGLTLDLAELRICETTGCPLHIDWYPREGMVMVIPIYGDRTIVHHIDPAMERAAKNPLVQPGEKHASLITAYGRWANFHAYDPEGKPQPGWRDNGQGVIVPEGVKTYLGSRAKDIPDDLLPDAPGVLPTVHQAATGSRMVMVLNFSYRPLEGIQTPYMTSSDVPAALPLRSSADSTGDPEADHLRYLQRLLGYDEPIANEDN